MQTSDSATQLKNVSETAEKNSYDFLKISEQFKLGTLPTEQPAKQTEGLSYYCENDLKQAINMIKSLDFKTLNILRDKVPQLNLLYEDITKTLDDGNDVYLCGCGATGRLSLALESLWRQEVKARFEHSDQEKYKRLINRVKSYMAGGDIALIKSVEDFEDHPEFGQQQTIEMGFQHDDLLIASTEGGETPWVIGCTNYAADEKNCKRKPFFLYCNPDEILLALVKRSREVLENTRIQKINLTVDNMAITGSTRMQATTIQMYAIGLALFHYHAIRSDLQPQDFIPKATKRVENLLQTLNELPEDEFLHKFTTLESQIYRDDGYVFYETDAYFSLTILTDTTERSPTFSLHPFENQLDDVEPKIPSRAHLVMKLDNQQGNKANSQEKNQNKITQAWEQLLGERPLRCLDSEYWKDYKNKVSTIRALGHDFSENIIQLRRTYCSKGNAKHYFFKILRNDKQIEFQVVQDGADSQILEKDVVDTTQLASHRLDENILLKILLNTHSTLVMGRLGKFVSNIMTWVRPSNFKLIDRSIRYVQYLLVHYKQQFVDENNEQQQKIYEQINYQLVCTALHSEMETLVYGEAIVLKTLKRIVHDLFGGLKLAI